MSIIATINVYKCDDCGDVQVVTTEEDCESFAHRWFAGRELDFCPRCKDKVRNQGAIEAEDAEVAELDREFREHVRRSQEAVHA